VQHASAASSSWQTLPRVLQRELSARRGPCEAADANASTARRDATDGNDASTAIMTWAHVVAGKNPSLGHLSDGRTVIDRLGSDRGWGLGKTQAMEKGAVRQIGAVPTGARSVAIVIIGNARPSFGISKPRDGSAEQRVDRIALSSRSALWHINSQMPARSAEPILPQLRCRGAKSRGRWAEPHCQPEPTNS